jgi:hypothetical protein
MWAGGAKRLSFALAMMAAVLAVWPAASLSVPLPEGRGYEQVSPVDKNSGDVGGPVLEGGFAGALGQSASDGNSIGYASLASFGDAQSADLFTYYISTRGSTAWSTHAISPPPAEPPRFLELPAFRAFASDLSDAVLEWKEPALVPEAPSEHTSLYLRFADGPYLLLTKTAPLNRLPDSYRVHFGGATADLSRVVFEANDALFPEAPAEVWSVYEWSSSLGLRLVSVLPDGEPVPEANAGSAGEGDYAEVISADGSRVFWTAENQLYVREGGVRTVKLNASSRVVSLGDGSANLLAISADGSKAFFSDSTSLTDALDDHGGLYEYDLEDESLRLLTPDPSGEPEIEGVLGVAGDGSSVYFVSPAALAAGAQEGEPNLYVERAGTLEFIATLSRRDVLDWTPNFEERTSRLTADGDHLAFLSQASLTGYDNTDAITGEAVSELFVYDAKEDRLTCVSCNPTGAPPIGRTTLPRGTPSSYQPHVFSADGSRIFFNSADALVPSDSDHRQDVYVFTDGKPQLISTGVSSDISALVDVGGGGRDVFFTTRSRLVADDKDNNADLYDARVGGGLPETQEPPSCTGEACRGQLGAAPQLAPFPATALPGSEAGRIMKRHHRKRCRAHRGKARGGAEAAKSKRCRRGR